MAAAAARELQIAVLGALARIGHGTVADICEALPDEFGRAYTTVATVLGRLVEQKLIGRRMVSGRWEFDIDDKSLTVIGDSVLSLLAGLNQDQREAVLEHALASARGPRQAP